MNDLKEEQTTQKKKFDWGRFWFWSISLLIIAIFLVIAIQNIRYAKRKAVLSSCSGNLRNLKIIITNYSTDHKGHYPQNLQVLKDQGYTLQNPICPISGKPYIYQVDGWDSNDFTIMCPNPEKHDSSEGLRQTSHTDLNPVG